MLGISSRHNSDAVINNEKILCGRAFSTFYRRMLLPLVVMTSSVVSVSNINVMNKISLILIFTSPSILVGDKLLSVMFWHKSLMVTMHPSEVIMHQQVYLQTRSTMLT